MKAAKNMMAAAVCMAVVMAGAPGVFAESQVKAGTYKGIGSGRNGDVNVDVTVEEDGTITDISVGDNMETPAITGYAIEQLPQLIVESWPGFINPYISIRINKA